MEVMTEVVGKDIKVARYELEDTLGFTVKIEEVIDEKIAEGKSVLLEIELQGALQVMQKRPDAVTIFIKPPTFVELENRLRGRHTETEEAIQKRLVAAREELNNADKFHYIIENDIVDKAVDELIEIYNKETK